ncbi:recombination directionality factor [Streptomyces sp. NPDC001889]
MPILDLQQRIRELGRIRIGQKVPTSNGRTRPAKLNRFRLTSPSRPLLDKVAAQYGGTVAPWTPDGGTGQYEVITDATRMPILVPHQPVSQYYELWSGGGCQRRCDGVTELLKDRQCLCGPDPHDRQCKPTTRLSVVLAEIPGVGVWRLESHGYYAALELPGVAELLARAGGYVPAHLGLEERTAKREGKTLRWMVPTIDVDITPTALVSGQIPESAAMTGGPERAAIEAGRPDYAALADVATDADEVGRLWTQANQAGHLDDALAATLKARGKTLKQQTAQPEEDDAPPACIDAIPDAPDTSTDEVVDAEIVDPAAAQDVWFQIIAAAGPFRLTTEQVERAFAERHGGLHPSSGSVGQLETFLAAVKAGEVA